MTALLIRRRRPIDEAPGLIPLTTPRAFRLDGTANAGRVIHALAEAGLRFPTLAQLVLDIDATAGALARLDLGTRFATVILGSHLVNTPDEHLRRALLRAATRHLVGGGALLIEHHPVDWAATAGEVTAVPGGAPGMVDIRVEPPFVSAVTVYDARTKMVRQPFTARVLSDEELRLELGLVGLGDSQRMSPTWLKATSP